MSFIRFDFSKISFRERLTLNTGHLKSDFSNLAHIRSTVTITGIIGLATVGSIALAYRNAISYCLLTMSVTALTIHNIPHLLTTSTNQWMRTAFSLSFIAIGSLVAGGLAVSSFYSTLYLFTSIAEYQIRLSLINSFLFNVIIGFGVPFSLNLWDQAYYFTSCDQVEEKLDHVKKCIANLSPNECEVLFHTLKNKINLFIALIYPNQSLPILNSLQRISILTLRIANELSTRTPQGILEDVLSIAQRNDFNRQEAVYKIALAEQIAFAFNKMSDEKEIEQGLTLVIDHADQLIDHVILKADFLKLFKIKQISFLIQEKVKQSVSQTDVALGIYLALNRPLPQSLHLLDLLGISIDKYGEEIFDKINELKPLSLNSFKEIICFIENQVEQFTDVRYPEIFQTIFTKHLIAILSKLNEQDLELVIEDLLNFLERLGPQLLTPERCIQLLKLPCLETIINNKILKLDQNIQRLNSNNFRQELEQISQVLSKARQREAALETSQFEDLNRRVKQKIQELQTSIKEIRRWKKLNKLWVEQPASFLFTHYPLLENILNDQNNILVINNLHKSLTGHPASNLTQNIRTDLELNSNRLSQRNKSRVENTGSYIYLTAERCNFIREDIEELKKWLNIKEDRNIQSALDKIALKTEADLLKKRIVPLPPKVISKKQIKTKLKNYIFECRYGDTRARLYLFLSNLGINHSSCDLTYHKVVQVFYRLITAGLILVPVYLKPKASLIGFTTGLSYFTLKHFNENAFEQIDQFVNEFKYFDLLKYLFLLVADRHIILLTPQTKENQTIFVHGDLFARMRILSAELALTIILSYYQISESYEEPNGSMGGFAQGILLAREFVHLSNRYLPKLKKQLNFNYQ